MNRYDRKMRKKISELFLTEGAKPDWTELLLFLAFVGLFFLGLAIAALR